MSSEFTTSAGDIVAMDWLENDEGATPHSLIFVTPTACRLKAVHLSASAQITSGGITVVNGDQVIGLALGLNIPEDGALTVVPGPDWNTFTRANTYFQAGSTCEVGFGAPSADFHVTMVFERTG